MLKSKRSIILCFTCVMMISAKSSLADVNNQGANNQNVSDLVSTDAERLYSPIPKKMLPQLAVQGKYLVGVRTIQITHSSQLDVLTKKLKNRVFKVEVWYPAALDTHGKMATYENVTRTGLPFSIQGDAFRNAKILDIKRDAKYPLIVISHGYTGYRTIMYYLGEHLASHGYIVAAIDHTDSTNADVDFKKAPFSGFPSTLYNRSRDQEYTLKYMTEHKNFTSAVIDKNNAGLIGYSMGAYGAVNTIGGCYNFTAKTTAMFTGLKNNTQINKTTKLLNSCAGGQYKHVVVDPKWKAVIAMAPWGEQYKLFTDASLAKITKPILYIDGELDDIAVYSGVKSLYLKTGSKYDFMLTYKNARHNIAPHPAPRIAKTNEFDLGHYYEPSWNTEQLNNINKHFSLAMMDCFVKKISSQCNYLNLSGNSDQVPTTKNPKPQPWKGFADRFSTGMTWLKK